MPLDPLTDQYIDETYSRLVQTNDTRTEFADGLGNLITFGQTPTGSLLVTASIVNNSNQIEFTKGNGDKFVITVNTGSGGGVSGDYVTTSSFNNFTSSYNTGSFSGSFTGSLFGTASWATNFISASNYVLNSATSSFVTNDQTSSFVASNQTSSFVTNNQTSSFVTNNQTSSFITNNQTSSFSTGSFTGSFTGSLQGTSSHAYTASFIITAQTASYITSSNVVGTVESASFSQTSSFAPNYVLNSTTSSFVTNNQTSSFLTTGSSNVSQTISGSLTINQNLIVLGSSSIQYVTSSQLDISTNIITVNVATPALRFGGLAVIDSGSSPLGSGSFLYDSVQDEFIFVHKGNGTDVTSSHFLVGPETYNQLGNEIYITNNALLKSQGNEHVTSSNIIDTGTNILINSNTQITGSLTVSGSSTFTNIGPAIFSGSVTSNGGFTGSFSGSVEGYVSNTATSSFITNSQTSSFTQLATGSLTASVTLTQFSIVSGSSTEFTVNGTGVTIGSVITDIHKVTGSLNISGSITGSLQGTSSYTSDFDDYDYLLATNFRTLYNY